MLMRKWLTITVLLLCICRFATGQDSLPVPAAPAPQIVFSTDSAVQITNKVFDTTHLMDDVFSSIWRNTEMRNVVGFWKNGRNELKLRSLHLIYCILPADTIDNTVSGDYYEYVTLDTLRFANCTINNTLQLMNYHEGTPGYLRLELMNSRVKRLNFYERAVSFFGIGDTLGQFPAMGNVKIKAFDFLEGHIVSKRKTFIYDCSVTRFTCSAVFDKGMSAEFERDSFYTYFSVNETASEDRPWYGEQNFSFVFRNCYIDANFNLSFIPARSRVVFENCEFGPHANLGFTNIDTLEFHRCYKFANPLFLNISGTATCYLFFEDTDIDKFLFDYTSNIKIQPYNIGYALIDKVSSTYETLIDKFKREGRYYSKRRLDIEYKDFKYRSNYHGGGILSFLDRFWWNYGYSPHRAIYMSFWLLILFFIINILCWNQISRVYAIIDLEKTNWYTTHNHPNRYLLKKWVSIFVFTGFIFFSFYINFSKVSFKKTRWLVLFFAEYLIGLFCLFFLVNAIMKF